MMEKSYKQYEELDTRSEHKNVFDEFLVARIKLTAFYTAIMFIIVSSFSVSLYYILLANFRESIGNKIFGLDPHTIQLIFDRTRDVLQNRIIVGDTIILMVVILASFLLTSMTLRPIKLNMQKQKRFVADASHELRTPIAVVISGLEVTLRNKNLDLEKAKQTLNDTLIEMREFSVLTNNLLDISKYDSDKNGNIIKHSKIEITKLVKNNVEKMSTLAKEKNISISYLPTQKVYLNANAEEITRVLINIIKNSINYTHANGNIKITDESIDSKYILNIIDNGVGIDESIVEKIFDPFVQGDSSRSAGGAGLGLTISKKIIESHGGNINIKSKIMEGTTVTISLIISS